MKLRTVLIGLGTLTSLAIAWPADAQPKPAPGVVTPEMRSGRTQFEFGREFDLKRLTDPLVASAVHDAAGEIASCLARRGGKKAGDFLGGVLADDAEYSHIADALTGRLRNCANTNAAAPAIVISGVLAEQLVLRVARDLAKLAVHIADHPLRVGKRDDVVLVHALPEPGKQHGFVGVERVVERRIWGGHRYGKRTCATLRAPRHPRRAQPLTAPAVIPRTSWRCNSR